MVLLNLNKQTNKTTKLNNTNWIRIRIIYYAIRLYIWTIDKKKDICPTFNLFFLHLFLLLFIALKLHVKFSGMLYIEKRVFICLSS